RGRRTDGASGRVQLRAAVARGAIPGAGGAMSGRHEIPLVATREIRDGLRSKAFIASTLLIVALLAVSAVIGRLFDPQQTFDYAVTAPAPAGLAPALQGAGDASEDAKVKLRTVDSAAAGRRL